MDAFVTLYEDRFSYQPQQTRSNDAAFSKRMKSASSSSSSEGKSMDDLRDDELMEIFLRCPIKPIHGPLKCVCKRWYSLISHPGFAKSYLHLRPNKLTCLILHVFRSSSDNVGRLICLDDNDNMTTRKCFSLSLDFIPTLRKPHQKDLESLRIFGVSNGLMLIEVEFLLDRVFLYLCNPVNRQWFQLPPTSMSLSSVTGFVCNHISANDEGYKVPDFIVVRIEVESDDMSVFDIQVFSSEIGNWRTYNVPKPFGFTWSRGDQKIQVVNVNGIFHWKGQDCIVAYDPVNKPHECDTINLPTDLNSQHLNEFSFTSSEGKLRLCRIVTSLNQFLDSEVRDQLFSVWELVDYSNRKWSLRYDNIDITEDFKYANASFGSFNEIDGDKTYFVAHFHNKLEAVLVKNMRNRFVRELYKSFRERSEGRWPTLFPFVIASWPVSIPQLLHQKGSR